MQHANRHREHFDSLSIEEQSAAIRNLSQQGMSDLALAAATGLALEQIRTIVGEPNAGSVRGREPSLK